MRNLKLFRSLSNLSRLNLGRAMIFAAAIFIIGLPGISNSATNNNYCSVPPFVQMNIEPNIMLFLDTSCDMSGPAYHYPTEDPAAPQPRYYATSGALSVTFSDAANTITRSAGSFITNGFRVGDKIETNSANASNKGPFKLSAVTATVITVTTTAGGNPTLTSSAETCTITTRNSYIGLFEPELFYVWNSNPAEWRIAAIQPVLPSPLPSGCYDDTGNAIGESTMSGATANPSFKYTQCCGDYTCKDNVATPKRYFKGSFMNFIISSRYDVMMKILVGGYGSADASGQIKRFETYAALPCTATCTTDLDCIAPQKCEIVKGKKQCSAGESEWEWVDPVTNCEFQIERESNEFEFEIEGGGDGAQLCTITGKTEVEIETTGQNATMYIAVDRYSDDNAVPPGIAKTTGLVQEYYDRAHWGSATIKSSNPNQTAIGNCLSLSNPTLQSFVNGITAPGNTPASLVKVDLATAYAGFIDYFKFNGAASYTGCIGGTKDPFYNDPVSCRKNFVLTLSSIYAAAGTNYDATYTCPSPTDCDSSVVGNNCSKPLVKNSCYAYEKDLRDGTAGMGTAKDGKQNLYHFGVFTMGADYENTDGCTSTASPSPDNPCRKINKGIFSDAANAGGGKSENNTQFFAAPTPSELETAIRDAINAILRRVTSGTAASVLASGEGSGANLVQATYYPKRRFFDTSVDWVGGLQNLWYYVDPFFTNSNIRAEGSENDRILNIKNDTTHTDYIVQLYYDIVEQKARAKRFKDTDGDGDADETLATIDFENLPNLWEAARQLWSRDVTSAPRTLKTWLDKDSDGAVDSGEFINFSTTGYTGLVLAEKNLFKTQIQASSDDEAGRIIRWVNGEDISFDESSPADGISDYRARTVALSALSGTNVWKLGDIINSTPRISSWQQLNAYYNAYGDTTYDSFVKSSAYKSRGMVYVGSNDGMLHAFKLGLLGLNWGSSQGTYEKATIGKYCQGDTSRPCKEGTDCTSGICFTDPDIGKEMWAFIPKNILPYLKYIKDPNYCHVYSVDLSPYIFDASIQIDPDIADQPLTECRSASYSDYWKCKKTVDSWRTILIGGMRHGGACRNKDAVCNSNSCSVTQGTACTTPGIQDNCPSGEKCISNCVNTPVSNVGYSSYFALDVTDQSAPTLLWEYSHPDMGFATSGPSIVRISSRTAAAGAPKSTADPATGAGSTNGKWFAVFGSGATGPIDEDRHQFLGRSDQDLKIFILDLKTGALLTPDTNADGTPDPINTGITNAFAGSMLNSTHDSDIDYQDDVVYIPYVKKCGGLNPTYCTANQWNDGGVLRLLTNEDLDANTVESTGGTALNPANWRYSKVIMEDAANTKGIGAVTSSIVRLQNRSQGTLRLFFGSGRYYSKQGSTTDDASKQRHLFGITEPCFESNTYKSVCLDTDTTNDLTRLVGDLADKTTASDTIDAEGWKIDLDASGSYTYDEAGTPVTRNYGAERVVTDPLATSSGVVFFTTYKPYLDECNLGGKSFIWATKYDTGGSAGSLLKGKALIQVSTGSIEQMDMSTAFGERGSRRTSAMEGVPPTAQGLSIVSTPSPTKRILHIRER